MVYLPDDLADEFKRCQCQEQLSASALMQKALRFYLHERKRQAAVDALDQAIANDPLSEAMAQAAIQALAHGRRDDPHRT
jgi:hypothetical protein